MSKYVNHAGLTPTISSGSQTRGGTGGGTTITISGSGFGGVNMFTMQVLKCGMKMLQMYLW